MGQSFCPARWVSVCVTKLSKLSTVKVAMNGGLCTNILAPWDVAPPELLPELVFAVNWGATGENWPSEGYPVKDRLVKPPGLLMFAYVFSICVNCVGAGVCGCNCPKVCRLLELNRLWDCQILPLLFCVLSASSAAELELRFCLRFDWKASPRAE